MNYNHPKELWILSFGKIWDTFSYFGTQTVLALYFIHIFKLNQRESYTIYGAYAAFAFSMPILGGIVSDNSLGSKNSLAVGIILNIVGNIVLMSLNRYLFCLGLATSLIGSGFYKSNSTYLVGSLYKTNDLRKESAFTWFYLSINIGGSLAPLIYGLAIHYFGWRYGFLCSAIGISVGGLWYLRSWDAFETRTSQILSLARKAYFSVGIVLLCLLLSLPFYFSSYINKTVLGIFLSGITYIVISIFRYTGTQRKNLKILLVLSFFAMFYFAAGLQIGTTVTLFIQYKINEGAISTKLPASTFSMLYSLFVVIFVPISIAVWQKLEGHSVFLSPITKLTLGIGFATIGMVTFATASVSSFSIVFIVLGYLFLSIGELVLTPAIYTAVSNLSPKGMKNTMVGGWLLFVAIGSYLSSILANLAHRFSEKVNFHTKFLGEFSFIALFTFIILLILILLTPRLSKATKIYLHHF